MAVLLLALGFLGVVAKDVAFASLAVSDDHFLGMEIILEGGVPAALGEYLVLDLGNTRHAAGKEVFAAGFGQFGAIALGVHACVGDKQRAAQVPAPEIGTDSFHRADIGGVAGQNPASDRGTLTGDGQGDHYLGSPCAFFGGTVFSDGCVVMTPGLVFVIHAEGGGGGIVEDQVHFQVEEVCGVEEDVFFHLFGMGLKQVHGFVHVSELELGAARKVDRGKPSIPDPELRLRSAQPVGNHGKESPLIQRLDTRGFGDLFQGLFKP